MESIGTFKVLICRHGKLNNTVKVRLVQMKSLRKMKFYSTLSPARVETIDGSANEGEDYQAVDEILTFEPMETEKEIGITIVDDNQWEPDEEFFLKLSLLGSGPGSSKDVKLGRTSIMRRARHRRQRDCGAQTAFRLANLQYFTWHIVSETRLISGSRLK